MTVERLVVVGGGIAGLAVLERMAGQVHATLLEREPVLAAHASGKNAAIYRPLEDDATTATLSARTLLCLRSLDPQLLPRNTGLLLASAEPERLRGLCEHGRAGGVRCGPLTDEALLARMPQLRGGEVHAAVDVIDGGVLDPHAITSALAAAARSRGATIRTGAVVAAVRVQQGRVRGVELQSGERLDADAVVLAAGAWGQQLGATAGAPLPLSPLRRHLVQLRAASPVAPDAPTLWRLDDDVYFRPETGGLLASPCDEAPWEPCDPPADPAALELLADKLQRTAPALAGSEVHRHWACLRTFAPDRELVAGPDPRVEGLAWLGGLGGRGMSVGLAAAEVVADALGGREHPLAEALSPARLL